MALIVLICIVSLAAGAVAVPLGAFIAQNLLGMEYGPRSEMPAYIFIAVSGGVFGLLAELVARKYYRKP